MQDLLETATELTREGRLDAAAELLGQLVASEPTNAAAWHALGYVNNQRGDYARAVEPFRRATALRPTSPLFMINLAEAYRNLGETRRAIGCCQTALRLSPDYPEALNTLGLAYYSAGSHAEAEAQFRRALELRPGWASAENNLALALQDQGQLEQAIEHFRRALEFAPDLHKARINLGMLLLGVGRAEEALEHFQEAVRQQPDFAPLYQHVGNALRTLDRFVEAREAYLDALQWNSQMPGPHFHIGQTLRREGQIADALTWTKLAIDLDAMNPAYWEQLAELQAEAEDYPEAIRCWQQVLKLSEKARAGPHLGLGWAYQEEGQLAEAKAEFTTALRLHPTLAQAQLNLGGVHEELGEMAEAEAAFRSALELQPNFAIPYARLATLLRDKLPEADLRALEERLSDSALAKGPRARLLFGLAHVLDARGEHGRAAACLREANALTAELATDARRYHPPDHERFVDNLLRVFDRDFFARHVRAGLETRRPIFVFGLPRSGTTLVEQILASHPRVHGAGELRFARHSFEAIPNLIGRASAPIDCIPHLDAAAIGRLAERHLARLAEIDGGEHDRIVDKMPDNYMYAGLLAAMFPKATFIHCVRDLRDIAVSCWMTDFRSIRWANDPEHLAARIREYRRLAIHWRAVLPVALNEVHYRDTVNDLEGVARRLLSACGLEWDPACLDFHRTRRTVRTASVAQVRQPIYKTSLERWRFYEAELSDLFKALPTDEPAPAARGDGAQAPSSGGSQSASQRVPEQAAI
jgi:tetratricopeptide (TPR) repeat protein